MLRGEAGVGKTALLRYVAEQAAGCRVLQAAGVQSEMELAFAGLHQLCAPTLDRLEGLPGPQCEALQTAFGLRTGGAPDHFLVALAILSLLADNAEARPLVCLIDDVQWLDRASAQALAFVARRLLAERIAMLFAVREARDGDELSGLPELLIEGLGDEDAHALLASSMPGVLDARVRDRFIAETRGNPLALVELPRGLTPDDLAGGFGVPSTVPLSGQIEQSFLRRFESLPRPSQQLVLTAAAEPVGDVTLLWRAAELLGIGQDAVAPAEAAGLIELGARVRFRHPLVRSAVYRAAPGHDRREVHGALAEATDPGADPDRRVWHQAHAATGLDEIVAAELARSADRARARGGVAAAAAFLERATELTPEPAARAERALAAAQAKIESGAPEAAQALLAVAQTCPLDELQGARLALLRAQIAFVFGRGRDAPRLLVDAARRLEALDRAAARQTYLEALGAAMYSGRLSAESGAVEAAEAARAAPPAPQPPRSIDLILDGLAARCTEGPAVAVPPLRLALQAYRDELLESHGETMRWLLLSPIAQSVTVFELWDDEAFGGLAARAVQLARETGTLAMLPVALVYRSGAHLFAGEFAEASALIEEADAIATATGTAGLTYAPILLHAWRGIEAEAMQLINAGLDTAAAQGEGTVEAMAGYAAAILNNGLGRYEAAVAGARRGSDDGDLGYSGASLPELVEAASRCDKPDVAAAALSRLEARAQAAGTDWALGVLARSRALLSDDPDALYQEAIVRLERTRVRVELARARLLYGEWLRRQNRRVDAREQLRAAHELFSLFGAEAFTERARRELLATGETTRARSEETRDALTPQEAQIAQLASDRQTNPEIGAQLYISARTVEYHLSKVFLKLGISSRKELRQALRNG